MAEVRGILPVSAVQLRRDVRQRIAQIDPDLRIIADDFMGLASPIDLMAVNGRGGVVLILLALEGEDDAALLTRALAQRAWAGPRVRDWANLAPDLELAADAPVRAILLAPSFGVETRAAANSLRGGAIELIRFVSVRAGSERGLLLEPVGDGAGRRARRPAESRKPPARKPNRPLPRFRSQLTDADLGAKPAQADDSES
ncbi:MAG: hypothetical protein NZ990_05750 [Myxococcota bacterium]|nr:hypothetical protein [Myxococcota bacterium]